MDAFAANQQAIATALLDPLAPIPAILENEARKRTEAGFAIHRNNVAAGLIDAKLGRITKMGDQYLAQTPNLQLAPFGVSQPPKGRRGAAAEWSA